MDEETLTGDPVFDAWVDAMPPSKRSDWITEMLIALSGGRRPDPEIHPEQWLSEISHRPNFRLELIADPLRTAIVLLIHVDTIDSRIWRHFGRQVPLTVTHRFAMSPHLLVYGEVGNKKKFFKRWIIENIRRVEQHEADEFLCDNGELVKDPHKEN